MNQEVIRAKRVEIINDKGIAQITLALDVDGARVQLANASGEPCLILRTGSEDEGDVMIHTKEGWHSVILSGVLHPDLEVANR